MPAHAARFARLIAGAGTVMIALVLAACGPAVTPEVIPDFSRASTQTAAARPSATPTGPTRTPTITPTPYARPTDPAALDLTAPIVRVGQETITLGQFRARVRYERFAALDDVRRTVERVGLDQLDFSDPRADPAVVTAIAGVFNTLARSRAFGAQVYDILVREAILRQEFAARGLRLAETDVPDYWIRRFGLQTAPDRDTALERELEAYLALAERYSGMDRAAIMGVAESFAIATALRPIIGRENRAAPQIETFRAWRLVAASRADAEAAWAALQAGERFRDVACRYATDPAVRGRGGDLGFVTRGRLTPPVQGADALFEAAPGTIIGPLSSQVGWYVFRVNETRRSADGDPQARVQAVVVATERLAAEIRDRAAAGEDFAALACRYSLDPSGGTGGDLGRVGPDAFSAEMARLVAASAGDGLFGPVAFEGGYEIVQVSERQVRLPNPQDLEQATDQAFSQWQIGRVARLVAALSDAWRDAIPEDPLPRDVAPFLREEFFGLPTPAPTPSATP